MAILVTLNPELEALLRSKAAQQGLTTVNSRGGNLYRILFTIIEKKFLQFVFYILDTLHSKLLVKSQNLRKLKHSFFKFGIGYN
jgi:hypothetical protein